MYKSTDAGKTWTHIGLEDTQHIGKIAVDPKNPNIVFVAAIGHLYAAHPVARRLPHRSTAARRWTKSLFKYEAVGASTLSSTRPTRRSSSRRCGIRAGRPWYTYQPSNGPGGGIYKSIDGGATWKELKKGLPQACIGRSGLAVSASPTRKRVYAIVDDLRPSTGAARRRRRRQRHPRQPAAAAAGGAAATMQGGLFRSDDAGVRWTKMSPEANESPASPAAAGISRHRRRPEKPGHHLHLERRRHRAERWWQELGRHCAVRPAATTTTSRGCRPMTRTRSSSRATRARSSRAMRGRRPARHHVEFVAQSADRADLSRRPPTTGRPTG